MGYEYTLGMGATKRQGSGRKRPSGRRGKRRQGGQQGGRGGGAREQQPSRMDLLKKIMEVCGTPCGENKPEPFYFSGSNPQKTQQNRQQAKQRKCLFKCIDDDGGYYYCCPSGEAKKEETQEEKRARVSASCGGEPCSEPGRKNNTDIKSDSPDLSKKKNSLFSKGCTLRCEEGGYLYYCCPSQRERRETGPALPEFTAVAPADQEDGPAWGMIFLGVVGLGTVGFAGYWFLFRKEK